MLEPRPEISTATRFLFMALARKIEAPAKAYASIAACGHDLAELNDCFAVSCKRVARRFRATWIEHGHHADATVERAQHFLLANPAARCQPLEYWQHRHAIEVYGHREVLRQDARNILGEAAAGDVRERFHGFGLADRGQARPHIKPRRCEQ